MTNHAKSLALHYRTDASPSSDGSAFFFCCESFSGELRWRQPIIQEGGGKEFKRSVLELWKWDCFLLSEIWIHLRASLGLRNHFPSQTSSAGCTGMSHKGAICVKAICFDVKCPWLTISSISLLPSFHFFHFLGDPDRECSFLHGASFLSICSFWQWLFLVIVSWFHSFPHSCMPFLSPFFMYVFPFFSCLIAAVHPSFLLVPTKSHPCLCSMLSLCSFEL